MRSTMYIRRLSRLANIQKSSIRTSQQSQRRASIIHRSINAEASTLRPILSLQSDSESYILRGWDNGIENIDDDDDGT